MTQNGFTMYMLSLENDVFNPDHARVTQDMSRPLTDYFISSSHNTYLSKDQVTGTSSTEPYVSYRELRQVLRARTGTECYIRYRALRQVRRATSGTESYVRYGELCQVQRARSGTES